MFDRPPGRRRVPRGARTEPGGARVSVGPAGGDGSDGATHTVWAALSDPARWRILDMLSGGEHSAAEIAAAFDVPQAAVSRQLAILEAAGLVHRELRNRRRLYVADAGGLDAAAAALMRLRPPHAPRPAGPETTGAATTLEGLPVPLDLFVGRRRELAELTALVGRSKVLTLVGPPGVGKTRLAREVAGQAGPAFVDGVRWVELARAHDAASCWLAVARALNPHAQIDDASTDAVLGLFSTRHALLVLDNCEHVRDACARIVADVMRLCPRVTVMATSQAALTVPPERTWAVPPLSVAEGEGSEPDAGVEAVQLFEARARLIRPQFAAETWGQAVREICRRLDGLPLAIELAAARVGVLTPAEIADRLDDRFALLVGGPEPDLERHQTLSATLDWSYGLLSPPEQVLLNRLSVFTGGADLAAVEAICGGEHGSVLPALTSLVGGSLTVGDTTGARARYRLLETIRAYGGERLAEAEETHAVRARHLQWFRDLAERAEPALCGPAAPAWLDRLDADEDNLRAAMDWAMETGDPESAMRIGAALILYWRVRNRFREGRRRLEGVLACGADLPARLRMRALWGAGFMALMLNEMDGAVGHLQRSLELAAEMGDTRGRARAALLLANVSILAPLVDAASKEEVNSFELIHETAALARRAGDTWCLAHALSLLGWTRISAGDPEGARKPLEDAIAVARETGDLQSLRIAVTMLGRLAQNQDDLAAAEALLSQGIELSEQLRDWHGVEAALLTLSEMAENRGDYERAEALLERAGTLLRRSGVSASPALRGLGDVALARGDVTTARLRYQEAAATADQTTYVDAHIGLGRAALADGDVPLAKVHFGRALSNRGSHRDAWALSGLAGAARAEGDLAQAASLEHRALVIRKRVGDTRAIVESLEALAYIAGQRGSHDHAVRLLGAVEALGDGAGLVRPSSRRQDHERCLSSARRALGQKAVREAVEAGKGLSLDEAVDYATRGRGARGRPRMGWGSITQSERQVVAMAVEGLSNAEIAQRLFISPHTAAWHLSQVYGKLGIKSRTQLAREVGRQMAANRDNPE